MDRFAIKIDAALRKNLYKICRLCGIDNPQKVPILGDSDVIDADGEPGLRQKIYDLIGFAISKTDNMPQTMCSLCVDKINDFYEFREMCYATNTQTRNLLGLKPKEPQITNKIDLKEEQSCNIEMCDSTLSRRGRKRKSTELMELDLKNVKTDFNTTVNRKKKSVVNAKKIKQQPMNPEIKHELLDTSETVRGVKKYRKNCTICSERFDRKVDLDHHRSIEHVPNIPRYICNACDQTHHINSDIKAHQLWHKLSKTPYKCGLCDQMVANYYAFSRHLRFHAYETPVATLVFDRLCPKCRGAYPTNFLYNIHHCAIGTKQCGGCNIYLRNESEYMRHAPLCPKMYLTHNKHIVSEVAGRESPVRIKNENEIEAIIEQDQTMQPFVSLNRISSPMLQLETEPKSNNAPVKKTSKKDSTKDYLKRVDKLLKSTLDTLVSIKQEPEVHVEENLSESETGGAVNDNENDDFHNGNESNGETFNTVNGEVLESTEKSITIKKELDDCHQDMCNSMPTVDLQIKEEPKTFALKLKITNKEGQLNSSLVDDEEGVHYEKRKKKKKRREAEKQSNNKGMVNEFNADLSKENEFIQNVQVKQERFDDSYDHVQAAFKVKQEPTAVMTSIPIAQFESSCSNNYELEDKKPNRLELDRLIQMTNVASGISMAEEAMPVDKAIEAIKKQATARKSTGALQQLKTSSDSKTTTENSAGGLSVTQLVGYMPKIVAVQSGPEVQCQSLTNVVIKEEPMDRGYLDEALPKQNMENQLDCSVNQSTNHCVEYKNPLDYSSITIKQEKDLEVYDMDLDNIQGLTESAQNCIEYDIHEDGITLFETNANDEGDDCTPSFTDEAEEALEEEEEIHVYKDISTSGMFVNNDRNGLMITSVSGQAEMPNIIGDKATAVSAGGGENATTESDAGISMDNGSDVACTPIMLKIKEEPSETNELFGSNFMQEHNAVEVAILIENQTISSDESASTAIKSNENASNEVLDSFCGSFDMQKESESEAQPFFETTDDVPNVATHDARSSDSEEEQQNVLNHEISAQNIVQMTTTTTTTTSAVICEQSNSADGPSCSGTQTAAVAATAAVVAEITCQQIEETENRINEQQLEQQQQQQQLQLQLENFVYDSNINEIAENNNNANIERELQDENNTSADNAST